MKMYKITQLSIFIENKIGNLYKVLDLLAENDINIVALSLADSSEFGILRIVVEDPKKAKEVLEEKYYIVKNTPIIGAIIEDTPGGLSSILKILKEEGIDLDYLYAFTHEKEEKAVLLLQSKELDSLIAILKAYKVPLVPSQYVYDE
ncbi:acetolactate synthase [Methanobrevibacter sp.]|uniref:acetolactate synthase n=1 Tax=Methanobrevibacter sp. TaxID=66852 RepID=UPI0025E7E26A|nr:acetolactate synthase [Methanobrevibacter sp.]MBQ2961459.1 acetolactate synthase [Methanobrevibacter sp.]